MVFDKKRMDGKESMLTVAAVQFEPFLGDLDRNKGKLVQLLSQAFEQSAQLIGV
jgi:predicted amidohydrolase